jgi:hypothetical protein
MCPPLFSCLATLYEAVTILHEWLVGEGICIYTFFLLNKQFNYFSAVYLEKDLRKESIFSLISSL